MTVRQLFAAGVMSVALAVLLVGASLAFAAATTTPATSSFPQAPAAATSSTPTTLPTLLATSTSQEASSSAQTLPLATTTLDTAVPPIDNSSFLPLVADVAATNTPTSTLVSWTTVNQVASSQVLYGTTTTYTATTTGELSLYHHVTLKNLLSGTMYHYKVSSTNGYGTVTSSDLTFTTPGTAGTNTTTPPNISMVNVTPPVSSLDSTTLISWTTDQPTTAAIWYGTGAQYAQVARSEADLEPEPSEEHIFLLTGLTPGMTYHYKIVSQNAAGTWSATAF